MYAWICFCNVGLNNGVPSGTLFFYCSDYRITGNNLLLQIRFKQCPLQGQGTLFIKELRMTGIPGGCEAALILHHILHPLFDLLCCLYQVAGFIFHAVLRRALPRRHEEKFLHILPNL